MCFPPTSLQKFYKEKKVLVTGHTGFKGTWLCQTLLNYGASIIGYSLPITGANKFFSMCNMKKSLTHYEGDIRDYDFLHTVIEKEKPEIIIHLAAQPIVSEGYLNPKYTFNTNVDGTINLLDSIRKSNDVESVLVITTDKVYAPHQLSDSYNESDPLGGDDPYSASKACVELIVNCYKKSFLSEVSISTARAGNVIGGGDFTENRIVPYCIECLSRDTPIIRRNPYAIRPYQHVLEAVYAYLLIIENQSSHKVEGCFNISPNPEDCKSTIEIVEIIQQKMGVRGLIQYQREDYFENQILRIDNSKIKETFGWSPVWDIETAVEKTIEWVNCYHNNNSIIECMDNQIFDFRKSSPWLF